VSTLSTHVLDAVSGTPAAGMRVVLERRPSGDASWLPIGGGSTDGDGRIRDLSPTPLEPGTYRLTFDTDGCSAATGGAATIDGCTAASSPAASPVPPSGFYPEVSIVFRVTEERHYHVPLLLSPFAYSTYRGS
jgi:5-hydroxyisourate hydrolase